MEIIPAIDIRGGKCVRLYQGDYSQQTIFDDNPVAVALRWKSQGARWLHIIDLDGAAAGEPRNMTLVEGIIKASGLLVELGGGIRQGDTVEKLLHMGVSRIILGTVAVEEPTLVEKLCRRFAEAIVVGLDARDDTVAINGWQRGTVVEVLQLARQMMGFGVERFIYTDIKRDGTLTGPNLDAIEKLVSELKVPLVAAGGISRLEHLRKLEKLGVEGAIIGRALYTGDIDLQEAINNVGGGRTDAKV